MVQPTGPSGVQPKKWLTPGVCTTATSTPTDAAVAASTLGLVPPASTVCPSWVPISEASATVLARRWVPVHRAIVQPAVAPSVVAAARSPISRVMVTPSEESGPSRSRWSALSSAGGRTAMASAGARSVSRLTSRNCRPPRADRPVAAALSTLNAISPRLPPTRMLSACRTDDHMARPSTSVAMIVSSRSSVTTRSAAARAAGVPRWPSAMPTSASRIAGASLAPSPVIATVRSWRCNAWMIRTLWAGVHRATTSVAIRRSASAASSSRSRSVAVTTRWPPSSGLIVAAIASAVAGWSPVIMTVCTPAARIRATAGRALSRTPSASVRKPTKTSPFTCSSLTCSVDTRHSATARIRCPAPARPASMACTSSRPASSSGRSPSAVRRDAQRGSTDSGAPFTLSSSPPVPRPTVAL